MRLSHLLVIPPLLQRRWGCHPYGYYHRPYWYRPYRYYGWYGWYGRPYHWRY